MSWNYALHGFTQCAKAVCTRWHEWIPPWWWFMTQLRVTAELVVALAGREAMSHLAIQKSLDWMMVLCGCKMEELPTAQPEEFSWMLFLQTYTHRHMHVRNVPQIWNTVYKKVHICLMNGGINFLAWSWHKKNILKRRNLFYFIYLLEVWS